MRKRNPKPPRSRLANGAIKHSKNKAGNNQDLLTALKVAASHSIQNRQFHEAKSCIDKALEIAPNDEHARFLNGKALINLGHYEKALEVLKQLVESVPDMDGAHHLMSYAYQNLNRKEEALYHTEQALRISPDNPEHRFQRANLHVALNEYNEAQEIFDALIEQNPENYSYLNNAGNLHRDLGNHTLAQKLFRRSMRHSGEDSHPYSNYLTTLHYNPDVSKEKIYEACLEWEQLYAPKRAAPTFASRDLTPDKVLRVGMISDGFRNHPVGKMIIATLERLPSHAFEFFAYSSTGDEDAITKRFKKICRYKQTWHLSNEQLAKEIRDDQIDILIDLAGHNSGARMQVCAMQPAPLQVKWVGGLINTTGLSKIDYLISDWTESPQGEEEFYTERLIRMPGDYICYELPTYVPDVCALPASHNGYITLGCFNNPMKVNHVVIKNWAAIMHQLPDSKLLLKGAQYNSKLVKSRIIDTFKQHGILAHRIELEGPSPHNELLKRYNQVDIALDPWPYSGGLTTCEAFAMGVPVVTMPGPTFAGRHSATHLVNAGMPELVTHSWEEYRARVLELASDLESLATIRSHLRTVLLQSPVCDADTFAGHLNNALRAIWQRYTEGKEPAALSFNEEGQINFEGESTPVTLHHPKPSKTEDNNDQAFRWEFEGKVIAIDHGTQLLNTPVIKQMLDQGTLELLTFDPANNHTKHSLRSHSACHYYPNLALGSGAPATLFACHAAERTGTLRPRPSEHMPQATQQALQLLTELPIGTAALDKVNELPSLDWLVLDELNDSLAVLEHGQRSLKNTLLIHAKVAFQPTHERQPNFTEIAYWASRNGFRFYCFADQEKQTPVPQQIIGANRYADELTSATALFIPDHERMPSLSKSQLMKLAFIADSVYGLKGLSYEVLSHIAADEAEHYISYSTHQLKCDLQPHVPSSGTRVKPRLSTIAPAPSSQLSPVEVPAPPVPNTSFDWPLEHQVSVVDIGANPIDGTPPYRRLLDRGMVALIGFEPQKEALNKLNQMKSPHETYLPCAVGDGRRKTLYLCQAEGMTSTLEPNFELLNRFQGYPIWAKVEKEVQVETYRLDELDEVTQVDWLKIDIQGGELNVFQNAEEKLKDCLVIQTEVNFIPLYKNQPLFAEIDQWMREHGFMLHTLLDQRKRLFAPMVINNQIHQGINQLTTADAVYVRSFDQLQEMSNESIIKLACIMHEAYGSYDYALALCNLLNQHKQDSGQSLSERYLDKLKNIRFS